MPELQGQDDRTELDTDAVIIGGGLAGMAAALHLVRGGLRVICLEPRVDFQHIVGESLDWSAPDLLADLGLSMGELVASGAATYKRNVVLVQPDGSRRGYLPSSWLAGAPLRVEVRTLHLDRQRVHAVLQRSVDAQGVIVLHEKAVAFDSQDGRIMALETSRGRRIRALWFIDASGSAATVLGREFNLASVSYGPRKVAIWTHVPMEEWAEGTTLYMLSPTSEYMEWIWEIPIRPGVCSIGYVAPGGAVKARRARGVTSSSLLVQQLQGFPRFHALAQRGIQESPSVTSFLCRTFKGVCGKNWIIIGEAASQSDPITGNGVTAALRHAAEASALICRYRHKNNIPFSARSAYNIRVLEMGRFFNSLIEKMCYAPPLRSRIGLFGAGRAYTVPAWSANLAYSRMRPYGLISTVIFCSALACLRMVAWVTDRVSRSLNKFFRQRLKRSDGSGGTSHALHSPR